MIYIKLWNLNNKKNPPYFRGEIKPLVPSEGTWVAQSVI